MTEKLADLESQQKRFKTIHVVTGSSDCNLSESTCESIKQNVKESIDQALKISENVQISSILPRTDDQEANIKAENTNLSLKDLCSEYDKVSFCDQDVNFRLADGSINDALLVNDGLHPNHKGSLRIINNLKLNARVKKFNRGSSTSWNYEPKQYNMTYPQRPLPSLLPTPPLLPTPNQGQLNNWNSQYANNSYNKYCTNCRRRDHHAYACPKTSNVMCYRCRCVGHRQKDCQS